MLQPLLRLKARLKAAPVCCAPAPKLSPTDALLERLRVVSLLLPVAAASVMSRTAFSVMWPGALMRAPMAVMSPLSAPVPVAVMVTLRPASMA